MPRTRRAIHTLLTSVAFLGATLVVGIVSTPIFLRLLGDERVGAFRVATDWAAYLVLMELGLSGALRARFAKVVSQSEEATATAFAAGVTMYRRVTVWTLIAAGGFAFALPWLIPVDASLQVELVIAWLLLTATSLTLLLGPVRPLLEGMQRGYVINNLLVVQSIVVTVTGVFFAWVGLGVASQALGTLIGACLMAGGLIWCLRATYPKLCHQLIHPKSNSDERIRLAKLNLPTFASRISGQVGVMSDNIVIGMLLGPPAVVPFFLTQRISLVAQGLLQSFSGSTWAGLADLYHRQEMGLLQTRVIELTRLITMVGVIVLAPILVFNRFFVTLWVGGDRFGGEWMTSLAVVDAFLLSIVSLWGLLFAGTEKIGLVAPVSVVSAVVNVIVSIVATYTLGPVGPLVGTLVALLAVQGTWIPHLLRSHFGISQRQLLVSMINPWIVASPLIGLAWWVVREYPMCQPNNWLELSVAVGGSSVLLLAVQWRCCLDAEHRNLWKRRVLDFAGVGV